MKYLDLAHLTRCSLYVDIKHVFTLWKSGIEDESKWDLCVWGMNSVQVKNWVKEQNV